MDASDATLVASDGMTAAAERRVSIDLEIDRPASLWWGVLAACFGRGGDV